MSSGSAPLSPPHRGQLSGPARLPMVGEEPPRGFPLFPNPPHPPPLPPPRPPRPPPSPEGKRLHRPRCVCAERLSARRRVPHPALRGAARQEAARPSPAPLRLRESPSPAPPLPRLHWSIPPASTALGACSTNHHAGHLLPPTAIGQRRCPSGAAAAAMPVPAAGAEPPRRGAAARPGLGGAGGPGPRSPRAPQRPPGRRPPPPAPLLRP
ncbi:uncharacterized protein LOC135457963 [Zonotrichia leucophrys gambelii]|uniref:uncharacterized protein LOC135457963 n=1 Tax=Zonotrichia leucophrys gambelii TaxID=257770 RepID=UPI0031403237